MSLLIDACVEGLREGGDGNGEGEGEGGNGTGESGSGDGGGGSAVMSGIRNRRTRTRNYNPLGGPSSQTMQNPDYQSDDDATGPDSWSNPDMELVGTDGTTADCRTAQPSGAGLYRSASESSPPSTGIPMGFSMGSEHGQRKRDINVYTGEGHHF